ncbi:hypothetical protein BKA64DRAFT_710171 [Cadophora sp. MPI-SDFR-AT-0126]|nr:hypothetical protein BKA64DRAFT_710171 [Leotiomycetes sp. MPI-SDFR-AT-0126]
MAILESIPEFEVTVCVDGKALKEYDTENDKIEGSDEAVVKHQEAVTVTKFIESPTDKTFMVNVSVQPSYKQDRPNVSFELWVDGQFIEAHLMEKNDYGSRTTWTTIFEGPVAKTPSGATVQLMKFSEIQSTDEAIKSLILRSHKAEIDNMGQVVVSVYRVSDGKRTEYPSKRSFKGMNSSKKYHNKVLAKQGQSHGVAPGGVKSVTVSPYYACTKLDGKGFPIAIYRFKYRSARALKDLQVIPQSVSPEPAPFRVPREADLENDFGDLSPEIQERIRRALESATGAKSKTIKPETNREPDSAPTIKRDHSDDEEDVKPSKKAKSTKKQMLGKITIDLTDVDNEEAEARVIDLD